MTTTITITITLYLAHLRLQGVVVGSRCDAFFGPILFVVTIMDRQRTSRPKHGKGGFVGGNEYF